MKMKILAVDDDEITRDILEYLIQKSGHEPTICSRGDDALQLLIDGDFHMVILDWEMPGMDGLELCRRIRQMNFGRYLYTIMLTSRSSSNEIVQGLSAGADDFVTKPFNSAEMNQRIRAGARILSLETRDTLIFTLAKLAESRDPDTGQHLERVQQYSRAIAMKLSQHPKYRSQIDSGFIRNIFLTSPLHDIGKVGVSDNILLKPGRLTPEEFEIMKTHTLIGAETLKDAVLRNPEVGYLKMAYEIALSHHERFDGTGYPHGLKGEEIPFSARIVALADVYDALTTKRVYKDAFSHEKTYEIIMESNGTHFDPDVVQAFVEIQEQFMMIAEKFQGDMALDFDRMLAHH